MLYSIVALLVVILDQAVKYWVSNTLMGYDVVKFIPGVVSLVCVPNDGAAFSLLSGGGARIYFIIVTVVFCLAVILALATNFIDGKFSRWCLVMVAAGGFANCIDRVIYGYVIDMFKVELFNFAIFNVADIFITVFAILFALSIIFEKKKEDDDEDEDEEEEEDDDEEEAPKAKRGLFARRRKDEDEDDDDEEEDKRPRKLKKSRREEEYQEYKAAQRKSVKEAPAPQPKKPAAPARREAPAPAPQPRREAPAQNVSRPAPQARPAAPANSDPFVEWERANAKVDAQRNKSYVSQAMGEFTAPSKQAVRPAAPSAPAAPAAAPARPAPRAEAPVAQPAARPAQQPAARPVQQPAPAPQSAKPAAEFSLDDILNEFK